MPLTRSRSSNVRYLSLGLGVVCTVLAWQQSAPAADEEGLTPVVVELFTSQGCSSCPPADELLRSLERNQPVAGALIIPLSEHVDYWNRLGWRDPFSSTLFSDRQADYVNALGAEHVYTPMMVVDGQTVFVGSRRVTAREAVVSALEAPKAELSLDVMMEPDGQTLRVTAVASQLPPVTAPPDVWLAITEGQLSTDVTHGENAFRTLTHTGVVRSLEWVGALPSPPRDAYDVQASVKLRSTWRRENLRVVMFLQDHSSLRIVGAAQLPIR